MEQVIKFCSTCKGQGKNTEADVLIHGQIADVPCRANLCLAHTLELIELDAIVHISKVYKRPNRILTEKEQEIKDSIISEYYHKEHDKVAEMFRIALDEKNKEGRCSNKA